MGRDEELLEHLRGVVAASPVERPTWDPAALDTAPPLRLRRRSQLAVAGALIGALLVASTGLAAAGALPDPAQHVAHEVLDTVGVQVPDPERYHGPECGAEVGRNHGAYVSEDKALAKSDCGKPVNAADAGGSDKAAKADDGDPCTGPPPWAGDKSLSPEAKATAQADRVAQCGTDEEGVEGEVEGSSAVPDGSGRPETTTTTAGSGAGESPPSTDPTAPSTSVAPGPPEAPPTTATDDADAQGDQGDTTKAKAAEAPSAAGDRPS